MKLRSALKIIALLCLFPSVTSAQAWSGILSTSRAVDWSIAGVVDGIPSDAWPDCSTSECTTLFTSPVTITTINNAITSAPDNTVVRLPSGAYSITCLNISRSNVVLRGQGANNTILNFTTACTGNGFGTGRAVNIGGSQTGVGHGPADGFPAPSHTATWSAGYSKDTTVITLSTVAGITAGPVGTGTLLFLDQLDDTTDGYPAAGDIFACATTTNSCSNQGGNHFARSGRATVQVVTATAVNGSDVTISPGIAYPHYRSGQSPGAYWNNGSPAHNLGLEDFRVNFTNASSGQVGVWVVNCANCWLRGMDVRSTATCGSAPNDTCARYYLRAVQSQHCTFESNYIGGRPWNGGNFPLENYEWSDEVTSNLLIQNNIFHKPISAILPNDPSGSNVFGYNYVVGGFLGVAGVQLHSGVIYMNLYEGNDMESFMGDIAHARHYFQTLFRNNMNGSANNSSQTHNMGLDAETGNRFFNAIGNVIGSADWPIYECELSACSFSNVYTLGWRGNTSGTVVPNDSNVKRTLMRWGNWDAVTSTNDNGTNDSTGTRFVSSEVPSGITNYPNSVPASQVLPSSFYLASKPGWFGSVTYPPIGPDVSNGNITNAVHGGHANKIPARVCYEATSQTGGYLNFNASDCGYYATATPSSAPGQPSVFGIP